MRFCPGDHDANFFREVSFLADSNITKRALASSLKSLMETKPFSKISVADICASCDMNRKSFYYHFKDKYDLVEWIFNTEFIDFVNSGRMIEPQKNRYQAYFVKMGYLPG